MRDIVPCTEVAQPAAQRWRKATATVRNAAQNSQNK